jgi:hypothetical protein
MGYRILLMIGWETREGGWGRDVVVLLSDVIPVYDGLDITTGQLIDLEIGLFNTHAP